MYPQFKDKHVHEALFHPKDYLKYRKFKKKFPKKCVITYQSSVLRYFKRKYKGKYESLRLHHNVTVHKIKGQNLGFLKLNGIGAPNAVTYFEELIALGIKEFINIGTAGGLQHEGIFLCTKALRDEGTSHHYLPHGKYTFPDKKLTLKFKKQLINAGLNPEESTTWTIDAPYRETKAEVEHYRKKGVATVEMEASALFAVARYRKVKIASAFVVSDMLGKNWEPKFYHLSLKKTLNKVLDSAIGCLKGK